MDVLDKMVELAQITGSVDVQCLFQGDWYVRHETKRTHALVHIVTGGGGYLKIEQTGEVRLLKKGDVVFLPRTATHVMSSRADCDNADAAPVVGQSGAFTVKRSGSGEADMSLFCARFEYDRQADLMKSLPEVVYLSICQPSLESLVMLLKQEAEQSAVGSAAVVDALSSVLLVLLVRNYLAQSEDVPLSGLLNGWRDRRLRGLIQAVLDAPELEWKVEDMVAQAGLSRAQLMRLFKQQAGISPHAFVNQVRLQKAAVLLRKSQQAVLSVALSTGFQSETHFGKVFKKQYGVTPGQYRKEERRREAAYRRQDEADFCPVI